MRRSLLAIAVLLPASCATLEGTYATPGPPPPSPWDAYVGRWTVDQATASLGRPALSRPLPGGVTYEEWDRAYPDQAVVGAFSGVPSPGWIAVGCPRYQDPSQPQPCANVVMGKVMRYDSIRCTFSAAGLLIHGETVSSWAPLPAS
jgi:hypothetical protein